MLLTREANGGWRKLIDGEGDAFTTDSVHEDWPDIAMGGLGNGPFPTYRWNAKGYALAK